MYSLSGYVVLEDNAPLAEALLDKQLPEGLFKTLSTESHGDTLPSCLHPRRT